MKRLTVFEHVALDVCGKVTAGAVVTFAPEEAKALSEDGYRKMAERVARGLGWLVCHVERGQWKDGRWVTPTVAGFPDNWMVHPTGVLLVCEFKSEKGRTKKELQAKQQAWLEAVAAVPGAVVLRSKPSLWPTLARFLAAPNPASVNSH